jgi:hypothetical protein
MTCRYSSAVYSVISAVFPSADTAMSSFSQFGSGRSPSSAGASGAVTS